MTRTASGSRTFAGLPPHGAGQRIGLLGGSFNPAHAAHRDISLLAIRRLRLDAMWWLVTPGNPLKDHAGLMSFQDRMVEAARVADHPRIAVSGVEAVWRVRYTADFVQRLKKVAPTVRFVWIMGSDNLRQFHLWRDWRAIAAAVPIAVINRPGAIAVDLAAPAAHRLRPWRLDEAAAAALASWSPPVWTLLTGPRSGLSSTAIRQARGRLETVREEPLS